MYVHMRIHSIPIKATGTTETACIPVNSTRMRFIEANYPYRFHPYLIIFT